MTTTTTTTITCPDWCDTKADHEDGFDGPHTWPTIPALDGTEEDMDDDGNSSALISVHDGTIWLSAPCLTMTPEQARAAGLGLLSAASWAKDHQVGMSTTQDEIDRMVKAVHKGDKHPTITLIRECRELGCSWPKAIREAIAFQYQGLGYRLLLVGEAITRAGYKLNGEQAIQGAWDKDQPGAVEEIFDAGREYQRRVTAREAAEDHRDD